MKHTNRAILIGAMMGTIDVIPMLIQRLSWDANISAFLLWLVSGFLISTSRINLSGPLKGILISFLVLAPSAVIIGWNAPMTLIPIFIITTILGAFLGFLIEKYC